MYLFSSNENYQRREKKEGGRTAEAVLNVGLLLGSFQAYDVVACEAQGRKHMRPQVPTNWIRHAERIIALNKS